MRAFSTVIATVLLVSVAAPFTRAADDATPPAAVLPELKPVPGKPVSIWFNYRTGDFPGASQIWGELRNDSPKPLAKIRIRFTSYDAKDADIGTSSDSVGKLAPGEVWSFEIHPREQRVRRFELKDVEVR